MQSIYLDNNSTTFADPAVVQEMISCWEARFANPASQHRPGQRARAQLEQYRQAILKCLGVSSGRHYRLIFTSGGTESNNLAIIGGGRANSRQRRIIVSAIEHPSILGPVEKLQRDGFEILQLPVDHRGVVHVDRLNDLINDETALVSLMLVNNETGVIQPVTEAADICRQKKVPLHCDAVQALGKIPVDIGELGISAMTLTAHKLHGPRGIGALVIDESCLELQPVTFGGFQQLGLRPGTEDVVLACGFQACVHRACHGLRENSTRMRMLRDQLEAQICRDLPDTVTVGAGAERAPHTSNLSFPGVNRQALLLAADQAGVAISTGSACASGSSEPSPVLSAMHCAEDVIQGSIRISLSAQTKESEIPLAAERIVNAVKHLQQKKSFRKST